MGGETEAQNLPQKGRDVSERRAALAQRLWSLLSARKTSRDVYITVWLLHNNTFSPFSGSSFLSRSSLDQEDVLVRMRVKRGAATCGA